MELEAAELGTDSGKEQRTQEEVEDGMDHEAPVVDLAALEAVVDSDIAHVAGRSDEEVEVGDKVAGLEVVPPTVEVEDMAEVLGDIVLACSDLAAEDTGPVDWDLVVEGMNFCYPLVAPLAVQAIVDNCSPVLEDILRVKRLPFGPSLTEIGILPSTRAVADNLSSLLVTHGQERTEVADA